MKAQGVKNYTLIMDRGFFSTDNIEEMVSADLSFIIPPTSNLKNVKEAISAIHSSIDDPEHLTLYEKEPLFVMPVSIEVGENKLNGYAYYDQKREQQERSTLYKRLYDLMEVLKSKNLKPWMNPGEVFRATAKRDAKFIDWKAVDGRFRGLPQEKCRLPGHKQNGKVHSALSRRVFLGRMPFALSKQGCRRKGIRCFEERH